MILLVNAVEHFHLLFELRVRIFHRDDDLVQNSDTVSSHEAEGRHDEQSEESLEAIGGLVLAYTSEHRLIDGGQVPVPTLVVLELGNVITTVACRQLGQPVWCAFELLQVVLGLKKPQAGNDVDPHE